MAGHLIFQLVSKSILVVVSNGLKTVQNLFQNNIVKKAIFLQKITKIAQQLLGTLLPNPVHVLVAPACSARHSIAGFFS